MGMWISKRSDTSSGFRMRAAASISLASACMFSITSAMAQNFVAGTTPDRRPEGAPKIVKFDNSAAWRTKALAGVSEPYPKSLKFLDDQGAWFTPFTRPGMPGPYDIRGLHGHAKASVTKK